MFYLSLVRNIVNNIDIQSIEKLRKHLNKSKVEHGFFIVKEISPMNKQLHLHACLSFINISHMIQMMKYIETHHLKAYVDKAYEINYSHAKSLIKYMCKDLTESSKKFEDFNIKYLGTMVWEDHGTKILYTLLNGNVSGHEVAVDDIFIDD